MAAPPTAQRNYSGNRATVPHPANMGLGRPARKHRAVPDILSRRLIANSGFPGPANLLSSLAEVSPHSDSSLERQIP